MTLYRTNVKQPLKKNQLNGLNSSTSCFLLPNHGSRPHDSNSKDIARLFAAKGVKTTIITTPLNAPFFSQSIQKSTNLGFQIHLQIIQFPALDSGLPQNCENLDMVPSQEMISKFFKATTKLQQPFEQLLQIHKPNCVVADMFFPWATDAADKFKIPRLVFHGTCFMSLCADVVMRLYEPYKDVSSDTEEFIIPNLPGEIKLTRMQLPDFVISNIDTDFTKVFVKLEESEVNSFGVIVNSFYELEPAYADYYRKVIGRKAWHIGPVSLCNRDIEDKAQRGKKSSIDEHECLKWLDSKKSNSVVYVCFGSMAKFPDSQLYEIAMGLESSGQQFIWVVIKGNEEEEREEKWMPQGFEERVKGKGLIIRGWAPQVLILDHEAVGGFVTHCGWNSTIEGVSTGVPMVTWPMFADQFYNEKLITQILRIGVAVGAKKWERIPGNIVKRDAIEMAVKKITDGEEADEMRNRAKEMGKMARRAVEEGGSSYSDLNALIEELRAHG